VNAERREGYSFPGRDKRKETNGMKTQMAWSERTDLLRDALSQGGAFLVANDAKGHPNPMTIGWGQVGIVWGHPVFTVFVRKSRYTFECIRSAETFTVNVPRSGELKDALILCGTQSGRDMDKVVEAGLTMIQGRSVDTPVIQECILNYECRILARTQQEREDFSSDDVLAQFYPTPDHHLVILGEIVDAYGETA